MASINKVILIGNLGRDPELRHTSSGTAVCSLALATSRTWKDKQSGEKQEETEWHRVVLYDRLAEIAGEYLTKGRPVYIEGRLKTRKWQGKEGRDNYTTEIVGEALQLLGGKEESEPKRTHSEMKRSAAPKPAPTQASGGFDDMDDDIPF